MILRCRKSHVKSNLRQILETIEAKFALIGHKQRDHPARGLERVIFFAHCMQMQLINFERRQDKEISALIDRISFK